MVARLRADVASAAITSRFAPPGADLSAFVRQHADWIEEELAAPVSDFAALAVEFGKSVQRADAVIIVSPEYNISVPASTKNAVDFLGTEWKDKPVGIAAISAGAFGARSMWGELSKILLHLGARPSSTGYFVPFVQNAYSEMGLIAPDAKPFEERAKKFIESILV